jgi:hypothetical protein
VVAVMIVTIVMMMTECLSVTLCVPLCAIDFFMCYPFILLARMCVCACALPCTT